MYAETWAVEEGRVRVLELAEAWGLEEWDERTTELRGRRPLWERQSPEVAQGAGLSTSPGTLRQSDMPRSSRERPNQCYAVGPGPRRPLGQDCLPLGGET